MKKKIVYGKFLITAPGSYIESGAVYIEDDRVVDIGTYGEITSRHHADVVLGSQDHIVMPGFVNAHSHGKGLTDFQRGNIDDTLETWKFYNYPPVNREYDTRWAILKYLEGGVTTTMHNHTLSRPELHTHEFEMVIDIYRDLGMKVAFAPTLTNQNWFVYGDNEAFVSSLPTDVEQACRGIMDKAKIFGPKEYMKAVHRLYQRYGDDDKVHIMHGPLSPQWVDDETLKEIARDARRKELRKHIHVQQTKLQKLYGYNEYGTSLIAHLDDLGFLDQKTTLGHAVWISEDDIALLAARGASVTHHGSCNFRVRNGIAPVYELLKAGVHVGIGMDDKEFGDDKDFLEEMRLISKLHRLPSHRLDSAHLLPVDAFTMATRYGAETLGWEEEIGSLEIGKLADMVVLDGRRISEPFSSPTHSPVDLVVYRAGSRDIDMVLVGGEVVVKNGTIVTLDRNEIAAKLRESIPENYAEDYERRNAVLRRLRPHIAGWFSPWYDSMERFEGHPYYHFNNRK